ncbi:MAG: N-acetyltransferase [Sphingobacterium sp.]|jgi:predicted GNAT family acetyltransferase|nr:N-acetyltransferase [Sphingobacterium sp.]
MKELFIPLVLEKKEYHFEMKVGSFSAIIEYLQSKDTITLIQTGTDPVMEGWGATTAIIEKTIAYIDKNNLRLLPLCPLVITYLRIHPEWKKLVVDIVSNRFAP